MTLQPETWDLLKLLGALGTLLAIFTGVIFWSVKAQVSRVTESNDKTSTELREHIDEKLETFGQTVKSQSERLDAHDRELQNHKYAQLQLRNEMLEKMHTGYVRHGDIEKIQTQISALFARLDKVIFQKSGGSVDS